MPTRVRDWATVDYYDLLGVGADASSDDIARAFRAAAKVSHPDATGDAEATEHFKDLAAAYAVLSDRRTRREYDRVRARPPVPANAPTRAARPPTRTTPAPWTSRRAHAVVAIGVIVTLLGVAMGFLTWTLHDHDASQRAQFVAVTAERLDNGDIAFRTSQGRRIVTREPEQHGEGSGVGPTVAVRYDPANPAHVIVDRSTFGRDITLAIVAVKLLIGGPVLIWYARRRRRGAGLTAVR